MSPLADHVFQIARTFCETIHRSNFEPWCNEASDSGNQEQKCQFRIQMNLHKPCIQFPMVGIATREKRFTENMRNSNAWDKGESHRASVIWAPTAGRLVLIEPALKDSVRSVLHGVASFRM
jgi:hypothetical protein